jgi:DNA-binding XRE family transcriptional regulator
MLANYESQPSTLGERIKAIRHVAGMGQDALARALGFSTRSLISWEKDAVEPPLGVVRQLCRDHDVDAGWLVFGTDTKPTRPVAGAHLRLVHRRRIQSRTRQSRDIGPLAVR